MINILIIDDEKSIADGLIVLINRSMEQYNIVGTAYNGIEGYDYTIKYKPDIVLTDIRMPKMDGLEMIRKLKSVGYNPVFIILSGYSEFEYARQAITMGVKFYITKPVEEEELYNSLAQASQEIEEKLNQNREIRLLESTVQSNQESIKEYVLRDLIISADDGIESIKYQLESCGFLINNENYLCALIELEGKSREQITKEMNDIALMIKKVLQRYSQCTVFAYSSMQIAVIISHEEAIETRVLYDELNAIKNKIYREYSISVTIGLGDIITTVEGISKSFDHAWQALKHKIINGNNQIIDYMELQKSSENQTIASDEEIQGLVDSLTDTDPQGSRDLIRNLFRKMAENMHLSQMDIQIQCLNILISSARKVSASQIEINDFIGKRILSLNKLTRTLDQLQDWLTDAVIAIIELKEAHKYSNKKDIIDEIKEHLDNHFQDNSISLTELSDRFSINPFYLSQLFKEKTGNTYLNYLTSLRINKAKELLKEYNLKVYEVCDSVGYRDANYFSKLFERTVGCKPSEYRKHNNN